MTHTVQSDNSPFITTKESNSFTLDTVETLESSDGIISPKSAKPNPNILIIPPERIDQVALFQETIMKKNRKIPIYNSRACYFFMNKMAVEGEGCYSICKASCSICYKSKEHPFFVMPKYTHWIRLGDYGVVINLNTPGHKAAYAICADLGPDKTKIINGNTVFKGKLGEASLCLGKYLKIKDSHIGDGSKAFQPNKMLYIIFPNTASYTPYKIKTIKEINEEAHKCFENWGGWKHAKFVVKEKYQIDLK